MEIEILDELSKIGSSFVAGQMGDQFSAKATLSKDEKTPKIIINKKGERMSTEERWNHQPIVDNLIKILESKFPKNKIVYDTQYRLHGWEWDIKIK